MNPPLWAPWRLEYIVGKKPDACVFCEMTTVSTDRFRELLVLVRQPHAFVCLNRYPFSSAHLLVTPRRHVADLAELADDEYQALTVLLRETTVRLRRSVGAAALNVGFNLGRAAGAGIADHLHGHVVPRWDGDTNFMPVLAEVRVMPQHLDATYAHLEPAFADLPGERAEHGPRAERPAARGTSEAR
jgi:ATP adenylyltransferase